MSLSEQNYAQPTFTPVAERGENERAQFITKTYTHLFMSILTFIALEVLWLQLPFTEALVQTMIGGQFSWLIVLGLFMFVSYIADRWAHNTTSIGMQYAGLGLFIFAESIIFVPLLYIAIQMAGMQLIGSAAILTLIIFTGLTAIVWITRKNFSFLMPWLGILGFAALGLIVLSILFGFNLGILFVVAMIALASGYIVYHTSAVLHEYMPGQHVAASLSLFASVALLFYYVLIFFMGRE